MLKKTLTIIKNFSIFLKVLKMVRKHQQYNNSKLYDTVLVQEKLLAVDIRIPLKSPNIQISTRGVDIT